jgi:hypothetical protein
MCLSTCGRQQDIQLYYVFLEREMPQTGLFLQTIDLFLALSLSLYNVHTNIRIIIFYNDFVYNFFFDNLSYISFFLFFYSSSLLQGKSLINSILQLM